MTLRDFIIRCADSFIFDINTNFVGVKTLTPFQRDDSHRVFGYFKCSNCRKEWKSAVTWRNTWQQCNRCESECYPYRQHVLENRNRADGDDEPQRPHDSQRCGRCHTGRLCFP